jgi:hypothetical protein
VHPWSSDARSWSILGAIVCGDETHQGRVPIGRIAEAVMRMGSILDTSSLNRWNDEPLRTQADALAALDAAVASSTVSGEGRIHQYET